MLLICSIRFGARSLMLVVVCDVNLGSFFYVILEFCNNQLTLLRYNSTIANVWFRTRWVDFECLRFRNKLRQHIHRYSKLYLFVNE